MANNKDFRVKNNIFVTGLGTSTFSGDVSIGDTLTVEGTSTFAGDVNLGGNDFLNIGSITTTGNATIGGNLTVQGTTTWLDTTNTQIKDANIVLNYSTGDSSGNANNAGITIQDAVNSTTDASLLWNTSLSAFKFSNTLHFDDGIQANFGTSSDLQILHDGTHSYIKDVGTGSLRIRGTDLLLESQGGETFLYAANNGAVTLYHDNSPKLATTSVGINVTGAIQLNGTNFATESSNGAYHELRDPTGRTAIFLGGSDTGNYYDNDNHYLRTRASSNLVQVNTNGLYLHTGTYRVGTTTVIDSNRNLTNILAGSFSGTVSINQGSSFSKLQIGTGRTGATENIGAVEFLNSSSVLKAQVYGSNDGQLRLTTNGNTLAVRLDSSQNAHFEGDISLPDVKKIKLGTGNDLLLYHDSESVIEDAGTNGLDIRTNGPAVSISGASDLMAKFIKDGAVELYHDNVKRLQTTSSGVEMINGLVVQGATSFNDDANFGAALQLNGTTVTSTAAELNKLDGFTGTVADLNYAKDLRATGVTATEFDYLDGVTSNIQTQIDAVQTVTINNNADNRLITGSGTAQTLNGEANLLFGATPNELEIRGQVGTLGYVPTIVLTDTDHTNTFAEINQGDGRLNLIARNNTTNGSFVFAGKNGTTTTTYGGFDASGNFEIGTTDVIQAGTRNLVNIGTISTSGNITAGNDINISGNELTFTNDSASAYIRGADALLIQSDYNTGENKPIYLQPSATTEVTVATGQTTFAGTISSGQLTVTTSSDDLAIFRDSTDNDVGIVLEKNATTDYALMRLNGTNGDGRYIIGYGSTHSSNANQIAIKNLVNNGQFFYQNNDGGVIWTTGNQGFNLKVGSYEINGVDVIDSSRNLLNLESIKLEDSKELLLGTSSDVRLLHNGTDTHILNNTGDLFISNFADDKDIVFRSDDGLGGVAEYFRLDGGDQKMYASRNIQFFDNVKANFGTSADLQIYHDGTQSIITDTGTGQLKILAENTLYLGSATGDEAYIRSLKNGAVTLYYDNSAKLATTSTGIDVTGTISASTATFSTALDASITVQSTDATTGIVFTDNGGTGHLYYLGGSDKFYTDGKLAVNGSTLSGGMAFQVNGNSNFAGTITSNDDMAIDTDTLFVDVSTDRVGINAGTAPSYSLHVSGDIYSSDTIQTKEFQNIKLGDASTPANTAGWFKIGRVDRGTGRIILSFTGGNYSPTTYEILYFKNWSTLADLQLNQHGTATHITSARIRQDSSDSIYYVEIYCASDTNGKSFQVYHKQLDGYFDTDNTAYTGSLTAGSASGTTWREADFVPRGRYISALETDDITSSGAVNGTSLQTSGTERISSNGNINNIGSITASGVIAGSSYKVGSTFIVNSSRDLVNIGTISSGAIDASGVIDGVGGSNSAPSYIFEGDTNTGLYHPAVDTIAFATGGSERGRFSSTGLSVVGNAAISGNFNTSLGGYQVGGQTVITSARNLENIGTISSGAITSSGTLKSTNATGLILDTGAAYRDVQFVLTGNTGNGTLEIIPMTVPGSGTAIYTTHFKNLSATGTTRHDLKVDGDIRANGGDYFTNSGAAGNYRGFGDRLGLSIVNGASYIYDAASTPVIALAAYTGNVHIYNELKMGNLSGTTVIDSSRNLLNINTINLAGELNFTGNSSKYIDFETLANSNSINLRHHNPTGNLFETAAVFNANGGGIINYDGSARMTTQSAGIKVNSAAVGGVAAPILNVGQLNNAYQSGMESSVHLTMKTYNPSGNFYFYKQSSILASIIDGDFCIGQTAVIDSSRNLVNIVDATINGEVGIGTTPSSTWKTIIQSQYPLQLKSNTGAATYEFYAQESGTKEFRILNSAKVVGYNQNLVLDTNSANTHVRLNSNGVNKLATTSGGIDVTGEILATSTITSNGKLVSTADGSEGGHLLLRANSGGAKQYSWDVDSSNNLRLIGEDDGTGNNGFIIMKSGNGGQDVDLQKDLKMVGTLVMNQARNMSNIGTITATQNLTLNASGTSDTSIEIGANTASNHYAFIDLVGDATYTDYGLRIIRNNGGANTSSFIYHRGTGNFNIETQDSASIKLRTAGTDAITIDSSQNATFEGNITATGNSFIDLNASGNNPAIKFESGANIYGAVSAGDGRLVIRGLNQLRFQDGNDYNYNKWAGIKYESSNEVLHIGGPAGDVFTNNSSPPNIDIKFNGVDNLYHNSTVFLDSSRNLTNIGTYSGSGSITVAGASSPTLTLQDTTNNVIFKSYAQDSNAFTGTTSNHNLTIGTNNTQAITINNSQNVGVGTSSISEKLQVQGNIRASGAYKIGANKVIEQVGTRLNIGDVSSSDYIVDITAYGDTSSIVLNDGFIDVVGDFDIAGALSKNSGSFKIDHPLKPDTHHLVHSFVEGPQADNLYRGKIELKDGRAVIDLDEWFGMTPGTFLALNRDLQAFVSNEEDWDAVRAKVMGSHLVIECQNARSKASVSWLVVGERQDNEIYESTLTDDYGKIIVEPEKKVVE